jgi:predicted RNA binding protein YcfA (HicA-like mRNA interferase family)
MYIEFHMKYPLLLPYFNVTCFLGGFSKNTQISNFIKISRKGSHLFHAYRHTDGNDEAKIAFHNFAKAHKNWIEVTIKNTFLNFILKSVYAEPVKVAHRTQFEYRCCSLTTSLYRNLCYVLHMRQWIYAKRRFSQCLRKYLILKILI